MNANGSEKKATKSACAWKKTKKFRFAFSPHFLAELLVATVLLLAADAIDVEIASEPEAPQ